MKIIFYRLAHNDLESSYFTSFKKAYIAAKVENDNWLKEETDCFDEKRKMPTKAEMKNGAETQSGFWITKEYAY